MRMADTKKEQERAELHRTIWGIADDLRGSVDGWDFKQYVLGMLFYQSISTKMKLRLVMKVLTIHNSQIKRRSRRVRIWSKQKAFLFFPVSYFRTYEIEQQKMKI